MLCIFVNLDVFCICEWTCVTEWTKDIALLRQRLPEAAVAMGVPTFLVYRIGQWKKRELKCLYIFPQRIVFCNPSQPLCRNSGQRISENGLMQEDEGGMSEWDATEESEAGNMTNRQTQVVTIKEIGSVVLSNAIETELTIEMEAPAAKIVLQCVNRADLCQVCCKKPLN